MLKQILNELLDEEQKSWMGDMKNLTRKIDKPIKYKGFTIRHTRRTDYNETNIFVVINKDGDVEIGAGSVEEAKDFIDSY